MSRPPKQLRDDLLAIWNAGVDGVRVDRLIRENVVLTGGTLRIAEESYPLETIGRIVVVGGGKASGRMAREIETILAPLAGRNEIIGWINVPEGCEEALPHIRVHPSRPMGVNEPTEAAVVGTNEILRLVETLRPEDLCLCLLSGGGSALLPAPAPGITLTDKLEVTRLLSESGASIEELNTVRKQLSRIKGGGLKTLCRGKKLIGLILSDVLGDPLDVIASGPTVDNTTTAADALGILRKYKSESPAKESAILKPVEISRENTGADQRIRGLDEGEANRPYRLRYNALSRNDILFKIETYLLARITERPARSPEKTGAGFVRNIVIGNNALAVEAAGLEALRRGYSHAMHSSRKSEGLTEQLGVQLADLGIDMLRSGPDCLIHGGEPVVRLAPPEIRGKGGRNQQLVLSALRRLLETAHLEEPLHLSLLSGGTDGEDGPTDAAGAWIDPLFWQELRKIAGNNPEAILEDYLRRNDAYRFFEPFQTLIRTGPTGTNVCDLRVVLVGRIAERDLF